MAATFLKLLVPAGLRLRVTGGAAYGTVKYGIWCDDSSESREKLERLKRSTQRERVYPPPGVPLLASSTPSHDTLLLVGLGTNVKESKG